MLRKKKVVMTPLGHVRTKADEEAVHADRHSVISEVVLDEKFTAMLEGIEDYSHVFVIFWMHGVPKTERSQEKTHPRHRLDLPKVGVLAVRERRRPNPIGLTVVELLGRRKNILRVKGLDAIDGTPVLDVKPYDHMDVREDIRVPEWWLKRRGKVPQAERCSGGALHQRS